MRYLEDSVAPVSAFSDLCLSLVVRHQLEFQIRKMLIEYYLTYVNFEVQSFLLCLESKNVFDFTQDILQVKTLLFYRKAFAVFVPGEVNEILGEAP